jgi:hypothetical protein
MHTNDLIYAASLASGGPWRRVNPPLRVHVRLEVLYRDSCLSLYKENDQLSSLVSS